MLRSDPEPRADLGVVWKATGVARATWMLRVPSPWGRQIRDPVLAGFLVFTFHISYLTLCKAVVIGDIVKALLSMG